MSKRTQIRAGIVGSGFSARFHYEALQRVYGVECSVTGVYSPTPENRRRFAEDFGIGEFATLDDLIGAVDVVHVCSPAATHESIACAALAAGRHVIIEKPFTGYFGDGSENFDGRTFDREEGLRAALGSVHRIREAERGSSGVVSYAENWVYAPAIQKEREILEKAGGQILWLHGEEAHSGSHSPYYGMWKYSGGGSLMGKGVHPLTAALYLKQVEGRVRAGTPIRPASVSCRTHTVTGLPNYEDAGYLRTGYQDVEDFAGIHVTFEDGTAADLFASELVLGGVHNWLEVCTNTHRTICNINPNTAMQTYNPEESRFSDIYVVEKIGTKQGWAFTSPDEDWFTGYQHEMQSFYQCIASGQPPESGSLLGGDTIATVYAGYLSAARSSQEVSVPRSLSDFP
ncbi:MAG: Gfo/Idh/MocA family protein [Spirochaetota bacterium]